MKADHQPCNLGLEPFKFFFLCVEVLKKHKNLRFSIRFVRKEFQKIAIATAIGFAIMGFIGFFVKLIHIPINNIIVGV